MSNRNMVWTHQVANLESERGNVQVQPENFYHGGSRSDLYSMGVQVTAGVPGNTTNVGICDLRSYYESINHQHQPFHNSYPYVGVASSSVFPSSMFNPCISTTAVNGCVPHIQSFGLGNLLPVPLYHQVAQGPIDESGSSSGTFGDSTIGFIKRKDTVLVGGHHFVHGSASSSSSAHVPQNPAHRPWNDSFESNILPSTATSNPPEHSSADGLNRSNSMAAHPELVPHGNYVFPAGQMSQCNTWIAQAANGITGGTPLWAYSNAAANHPGPYVYSGPIAMPNGSLQGYQAGPSAICHGPLPYFGQNPMHIMQAPSLFNHIQLQVPHQQWLSNNSVHGVNPSGTGLPVDPRILAVPSHSEHIVGPLFQPSLANQVNNGSSRILPYENARMVDLSRFYEPGRVSDEHRDMRLDIDTMTYEELVALEEQIGNVNTGLKESYIRENLDLGIYVPEAACMPDESSVENDACIICQEEYEAAQLTGTLDCGHKYHAVCIKQWLTVKNICPICKTTAMPPADTRNR